MIPAPRFSLSDCDRAHEDWGCNCGPAALAAICNLTLDEVRPHMILFEQKRYTNPTMMIAALQSMGRKYNKTGHKSVLDYPFYGLCLVQWEGPWCDPKAHKLARYRYTHWVGACRLPTKSEAGIFDVNCLNNGSGWCRFADWVLRIVPHLTSQYKRATGGWHFATAIEVHP